MDRPKFDAAQPNHPLVRQVVLQRLRQSPGWEQIEDDNAKGFKSFVDFDPPRPNDADVFGLIVLDVFWQLVTEGVLAPGKSLAGAHMQNLPWFHRTAYGQAV